MREEEFDQFVTENGRDILRFCRMTTESRDRGDELYQDTMLKLLAKRRKLDPGGNTKSYAISAALLLWKNKKKKYLLQIQAHAKDGYLPLEFINEAKQKGKQVLKTSVRQEADPEGNSGEISFHREWKNKIK